MNKKITLIQSELNNLDMRTDVDRVRFKIYAIYIEILLNHDLFQYNDDTKLFCQKLNISFKDYVFRSRTLLISRVIRLIEKADIQSLILYKSVADSLIESYSKNNLKKNKIRNDKLKKQSINIIDKFGRN